MLQIAPLQVMQRLVALGEVQTRYRVEPEHAHRDEESEGRSADVLRAMKLDASLAGVTPDFQVHSPRPSLPPLAAVCIRVHPTLIWGLHLRPCAPQIVISGRQDLVWKTIYHGRCHVR